MIKKLNSGIVPTEEIITGSGKIITKCRYDSFCRIIERAGVIE